MWLSEQSTRVTFTVKPLSLVFLSQKLLSIKFLTSLKFQPNHQGIDKDGNFDQDFRKPDWFDQKLFDEGRQEEFTILYILRNNFDNSIVQLFTKRLHRI